MSYLIEFNFVDVSNVGMRSRFAFIWKAFTSATLCRLLIVIYIIIPFILKFVPSVFLQTVFSNRYKGPAVFNQLSQPEKDWNFTKASNHYIPSHSGNRIGVWHLPPMSESITSLNKASNIIIYCHGKSGNRATGHRIGFYEVLRTLGFHVVAFDYSGFGDSTGAPDGKTVTMDTISVYEWVRDQVQTTDPHILMWGHSLGSAIVVSALSKLAEKPWTPLPQGVILESTFTNLFEASKGSSLFRLFDLMYPYVFGKLFKSAARESKMEFDNLRSLPKIKSNILILHSEDDPKISVRLSQRLFDTLTVDPEARVKSLQFYKFDSRYALGHNLVYSFENLSDILLNFTATMQKPELIGTKMRYEQFRV